jgi:mRNA interferase RelE/StbE
LPWTIEIAPRAQREFEKLDRAAATRIRQYLVERIAPLEDVRQRGDALTGSELGHLWRYKVGEYRIICDIQDHRLVVLVVSVGNRKNVYTRL